MTHHEKIKKLSSLIFDFGVMITLESRNLYEVRHHGMDAFTKQLITDTLKSLHEEKIHVEFIEIERMR